MHVGRIFLIGTLADRAEVEVRKLSRIYLIEEAKFTAMDRFNCFIDETPFNCEHLISRNKLGIGALVSGLSKPPNGLGGGGHRQAAGTKPGGSTGPWKARGAQDRRTGFGVNVSVRWIRPGARVYFQAAG